MELKIGGDFMTLIHHWMQTPMILYTVVTWSIVWKGLALWRAARLRQAGWYIALLVINTVGIFEIIYLVATNKRYKESNRWQN
jgi:hypothetical protein